MARDLDAILTRSLGLASLGVALCGCFPVSVCDAYRQARYLDVTPVSGAALYLDSALRADRHLLLTAVTNLETGETADGEIILDQQGDAITVDDKASAAAPRALQCVPYDTEITLGPIVTGSAEFFTPWTATIGAEELMNGEQPNILCPWSGDWCVRVGVRPAHGNH